MNGLRSAVLVLAVGQAGWAQEAVEQQEVQYARVIAKETQVRCFASDRSPVYDDRLVEGQVVIVGEQVGEYREIELPLGATGYVHKKFATDVGDGKIEAAAAQVSFRYRPKSSEVPALVMPKGTSLLYLGEEGEWWKVAHPGAPVYLPVSELQVMEEVNDTLVQSYKELEKTRLERWAEAVAELEEVRLAAAKLLRQREELDALAARFQEMAADRGSVQDYGQLTGEVDVLIAVLPPESVERARAVGLQRAIEQEKLVAEAVAAIATEIRTVDRAAEILSPEVSDPLARFDGSGWLHYDELEDGSDYYTLEKGGRVLFSIVCNSGRYDLTLFKGIEIGVRGVQSRPDSESFRQLDLMKIEILNTGR